MKGKIILFFILAMGFLAFVPAKTNAGCCEYFERTLGAACSNGESQQGCEANAKTFNENNKEKKLQADGKYYPKKECKVTNTWGKRCECPNEKNCLELQIPFPGSKTIEDAAFNQQFSDLIAKYIIRIFQFGIWIAISLAIFMIMLAGFIWLISAGNMGLIGKAKGYITNALYGLIVALLAFIMLQTINPKLVELKMPALNSLTKANSRMICCKDKDSKEQQYKVLQKEDTCQTIGAMYGTSLTECFSGGVCQCYLQAISTKDGSVLRNIGKRCYKKLSSQECSALSYEKPEVIEFQEKEVLKCEYTATVNGQDPSANIGNCSWLD